MCLISEGFSSVSDVRMLLESFCTEEVRQKSQDTDNPEELLKYILQEEARLTAKPNCYSGPVQVRFLAGYLDQSIQMHSINLKGTMSAFTLVLAKQLLKIQFISCGTIKLGMRWGMLFLCFYPGISFVYLFRFQL